MNEREAYLVLHKASGIKVGDTVKVVRKAADHEMGWQSPWGGQVAGKYEIIGEPVSVIKDYGHDGFVLQGGNLFPFFVLEKIASAPEKTAIDTVIDAGDFGCRTEAVRKLVHAIIKECTAVKSEG